MAPLRAVVWQQTVKLPQLEATVSFVILGSDGYESFGHERPTCAHSSVAIGGSSSADRGMTQSLSYADGSGDGLLAQVDVDCSRHAGLGEQFQNLHRSVWRYLADMHGRYLYLCLLCEDFGFDEHGLFSDDYEEEEGIQ